MSLLTVEGLQVHFGHEGNQVQALYDVDLTIEPGEIVGLVGESGSGKTVTSLALMGLLDPRSSRIEGRAVLDGKPLWQGKGEKQEKGEKRTPRRDLPMAMIFQEPMTALDPVFTVGSQLVETLRIRRGMGKAQARTESLSLLEAVGISDPKARMKAYPHELSGGMRQRVMIAIALACDPKLLIADEPTTAVDVTIQAQLLDLIKNLAKERGMAVLFVTHDLGVVSETCDRMITMYAGRIVERGPVAEVLASPGHPYTAGLLAALPSPESRGGRLATIPGRVPPPGLTIPGCVFESRCPYSQPECSVPQALLPLTPTREVRCCRSNELDFEGVSP